MAKSPNLPKELSAYIKTDETQLHCDDGDWDLLIEPCEKSAYKNDLPPRSLVLAENGSGDCLFLKPTGGGKFDSKVFVHWHEEDRDDVFSRSLKELLATSEKYRCALEEGQPEKSPAANAIPIEHWEAKLAKLKGHERWAVMREFARSDFGLEALPFLRRVLAEHDISMTILAAECIAKLGPAAAASPAAQSQEPIVEPHVDKGDLMEQLRSRGAHLWTYSGYINAYPACLDALVKLEWDPEWLLEFVSTHIGFDLLHSLEALAAVGTPEAHDLAKRAVDFWLPELNMTETKKAKALLASIKAKAKGKRKK
ncbi:MAG TPA: hypothetical protein VH518_12250 [Tepidisphaeraceae bacterium]|jgi:hypothetical protein